MEKGNMLNCLFAAVNSKLKYPKLSDNVSDRELDNSQTFVTYQIKMHPMHYAIDRITMVSSRMWKYTN